MAREINKELIEKQAKEILDKFAKALEKVEKEPQIESFVDREEFERQEKEGVCCDDTFKKRILENSPNHDDDFVIAETGGWK